jgi:hypothetical protein
MIAMFFIDGNKPLSRRPTTSMDRRRAQRPSHARFRQFGRKTAEVTHAGPVEHTPAATFSFPGGAGRGGADFAIFF